VVDVTPDALIVEITGTEDKIDGLVEVLRPFDIIEMVRTGRVAMTRGSEALTVHSEHVPARLPEKTPV
jgi:acetolactate synthase-1/3 small subunit